MKFQDCLKLAESCDLETVSEAWYNVVTHAAQIFENGKIAMELQELHNDMTDSGANPNDKIVEWMEE